MSRARTYRLLVSTLLLLGFASPTKDALAAATFYPMEGFEDGVDLVIAPNQEFMVVPTEQENGGTPRLKFFDLNPVTGQVIALRFQALTLGWENGVDPIIVRPGGVAGPVIVIAPTETEDGTHGQVLVMEIDDDGNLVQGVGIDLGDLGFEDDVDAVALTYPATQHGVLIPLEKEDESAAGILAIALDGADFGRCAIIASDVRDTACENDFSDPLVKGFVDGVDGIAYMLEASARLAIPLQRGSDATTADIGFFDFEFQAGMAPNFLGSSGVKALNAANARTLPFPGFERDVDIARVNLCLGQGPSVVTILVPVEDSVADTGDLYLLDGTSGIATWRYSYDNAPAAPRILGYEEGVDLLPWCDAGTGTADLAVIPTENERGSDADLILVNLSTGIYAASLEARNPGVRVLGYEKGVEPLLWADGTLLVPEDDEHGRANLLAVNTTALITGSVEDPVANPSAIVFGFERSVDPLVMPVGNADTTLWVPIERQDESDADLLIFPGPAPSFAGRIPFEAHTGEIVAGYERDVDPFRVDKRDGYAYVYVPEETEGGGSARLRVHPIPGGPEPQLVLATEGTVSGSANLFFVQHDGDLTEANPDALGFELGLDGSSIVGDTLDPNPPSGPPPLGFDADTDNTLSMSNSYYLDMDGDGRDDAADCAPLDGGAWSEPVEVDALAASEAAGVITLIWTGQAALSGLDTGYDIATGLAGQLQADRDFRRASCLADSLPTTSYVDPRAPAGGQAYYYLVRAQNVCGTGSYGSPDLDARPICP